MFVRALVHKYWFKSMVHKSQFMSLDDAQQQCNSLNGSSSLVDQWRTVAPSEPQWKDPCWPAQGFEGKRGVVSIRGQSGRLTSIYLLLVQDLVFQKPSGECHATCSARSNFVFGFIWAQRLGQRAYRTH